MQKDVLITDFVHPVLIPGLHALGYTTTYAPAMTREEMERVLPLYKGVVVNTRCALDEKAIASAGQLRWIARLGSGLDIIDLEAAKSKNITVLSAPEGNAQAVAEHAMGMLLTLRHKLATADQSVRRGAWEREGHRGQEVMGKTIGIIGYGNNGSAFARLWKGWSVNVIAYDKYLRGFGDDFVKEVSLEALQQEADIISLHIPLTPETTEMVDKGFLGKCKKGLVLINTARGKNVRLEDVVAAMQSGQLSGVCLDVFPYEPPQKGSEDFKKVFDALCQMPNVVLSPHVAGWTVESKQKIAEVLLRKISTVSIPG